MANTDNIIVKHDLKDYKIKVLLVDDQPIVGEQVRRMIEGENDIEYHYCKDPNQAIKMAEELKPTLILQDLVMPDIDGMTLVKFYRAHKQLKDVPLIVLSSKEEPVTKAEAFAVGANDYLVKLPDRIELLARMRYHSTGYIHLLEKNDAYQALLQSQEALQSELNKAAEYVRSLLPKPVTEGNILTDWRFIPSEQLGGDSFSYNWIDEDHLAIYLLDVCGHGVGSALMSIAALNSLRSQSLPNTDFRKPEQVLTALNSSFQMADHNDMYFTIWYGVYNIRSSEMAFASAGHPPALVLTGPDKKISELSASNFIVGGLPDYPYKSESRKIELPATIYLFSDGVYEIEKDIDGKMWTIEEMFSFMQNAARSGNEIDGLYEYVKKLGGSDILSDDFSMLRISING